MKSDIEKIIHSAVHAPSGENCQPWIFKVRKNKVSLFNVEDADKSLYNSLQKGSYVSHGAVLENIMISAEKYGLTTTILLFPHKEDESHVADVLFEEGSVTTDNLDEYIATRCTNRKDFSGEKLSEIEKKKLIDSVTRMECSTFKIVQDDLVLPSLGKDLALNEKILFENKYIHDFFYEHIIWDKKDEEKAGGFYIDTLEFLPHQLKAVKIFKNWLILSMANKIAGISSMIAKENGEKYAKSGNFGALIMKGHSREDYVNMGRSMQRIWLTATSLGIAMHPCNGTIYFMEQIEDSKGSEFSQLHHSLIKESYKNILSIFGVEKEKIGFIFRMGKADKPTARAKRLKPVILYL
jgi:nitroreductase